MKIVAFLSAMLFGAHAVKVGDKIPTDIDLHFGFPPENVNLSQRIAGKKVIIMGLPGAFTPTWSTRQVPGKYCPKGICHVAEQSLTSYFFFAGYLAKEDALKQLGVDEVIVYCVNDGAVMAAWSEDQGVPTDSIIKLMGDPYAILTEKLDLELTHAGPKSVGLINRCKRHALYVVDGKVEIVRVAEKEDDPAGMF